MKNTLLFLPILLFLACSQPKKMEVTVSGSYDTPIVDQPVKVELIQHNELDVIHSFNLDASGDFKVNFKLDEPSFVRLNFYGKHIVNMVLENGDNVELVKTEDDFNQPYRIKGSKNTDYIYQITNLKREFENQSRELNAKFIEARNSGNMNLISNIKNEFVTLQKKNTQNVKEEIWKMDNSISGILSTSFLDIETEFSFLDSLAKKYNQQLPNSSYTTDLIEQVNGLKQLAVGSEAPDINLPNPEGQLVKLSSLKGSYVLIDFWAAWCAPCRKENPNVVRMYNKYHDKGFDIYSVSLDRNKESWIQAIQKDGLEWTHVSDLKYFQSEAAELYQINAIPATFLIDPTGKIIGKNLRGAALESKLQDIFG